MNKAILMGRATRDAEVRYTQGEKPLAVARFNLAVDRIGKDNEADFINIVAFGKSGEFCEKYVKKGIKLLIEGRIQTGSYTNKDGTKIYTTDVIAEHIEFAESKASTEPTTGFAAINAPIEVEGDGFANIPAGIDEELPFR